MRWLSLGAIHYLSDPGQALHARAEGEMLGRLSALTKVQQAEAM